MSDMRPLENKIHIFCEGEKTEPLYIENYIEDAGKNGKVEVVPTRKNTPIQLVNRAIKLKKSSDFIEGDKIWVVYDRESTSKIPTKTHCSAFKKAKDNGINVALSNVCFEYWVLLHFEYTDRPYTSFDNLMRDSNLKKHLRELGINTYDKGDDILYFKICGNINTAKKRAQRLMKNSKEFNPKGSNPYDINPSTNIYELLLDIDNF